MNVNPHDRQRFNPHDRQRPHGDKDLFLQKNFDPLALIDESFYTSVQIPVRSVEEFPHPLVDAHVSQTSPRTPPR